MKQPAPFFLSYAHTDADDVGRAVDESNVRLLAAGADSVADDAGGAAGARCKRERGSDWYGDNLFQS